MLKKLITHSRSTDIVEHGWDGPTIRKDKDNYFPYSCCPRYVTRGTFQSTEFILTDTFFIMLFYKVIRFGMPP